MATDFPGIVRKLREELDDGLRLPVVGPLPSPTMTRFGVLLRELIHALPPHDEKTTARFEELADIAFLAGDRWPSRELLVLHRCEREEGKALCDCVYLDVREPRQWVHPVHEINAELLTSLPGRAGEALERACGDLEPTHNTDEEVTSLFVGWCACCKQLVTALRFFIDGIDDGHRVSLASEKNAVRSVKISTHGVTRRKLP